MLTFLSGLFFGPYMLFLSFMLLGYTLIIKDYTIKMWWQDFREAYFTKENLPILFAVITDLFLLVQIFQKVDFLLAFPIAFFWILLGWFLLED